MYFTPSTPLSFFILPSRLTNVRAHSFPRQPGSDLPGALLALLLVLLVLVHRTLWIPFLFIPGLKGVHDDGPQGTKKGRCITGKISVCHRGNGVGWDWVLSPYSSSCFASQDVIEAETAAPEHSRGAELWRRWATKARTCTNVWRTTQNSPPTAPHGGNQEIFP